MDIFHIARQFRGIVVLHDVVLYSLFAGLGRAGLIKHLWLNYGQKGAAEIDQIIADCTNGDILRYQHPENHALTASVFPHASRIIVHNNAARERVISLGYRGAVQVIPLATFPRADICVITEERDALRRKHSIAENDLVIACVGFIGRTKRIDQVCRALGALKGEFKLRFIIVGEGDDLTGMMIEEAGLTQLTIWTGFVNKRAFSNYLGLTGIMVNLRYPRMGGSSATLSHAMRLGGDHRRSKIHRTRRSELAGLDLAICGIPAKSGRFFLNRECKGRFDGLVRSRFRSMEPPWERLHTPRRG